jgi:predicted O-methyltransferase YrrM
VKRLLADHVRAVTPQGIKQLSHRLRHAFETSIAPRAADPYATHLPILIGLARLMKVRRVLELGTGLHSTPCFLERQLFPDLLQWHGIENDFVWSQKVAAAIDSDRRAKLTFVSQPIHCAVRDIDLAGFDLIFIDDSAAAEQRAATIREVARRCPHSTVVVIHDWEIAAYRAAAKALPQRFGFNAFNPNTGIAWRTAALHRRQLKSLNRHLRYHARHVAPDQRTHWSALISQWHHDLAEELRISLRVG